LEFLIQEKLFGDTNINKLISDYKIPPQHNIQFYLKAKKPEEFESFYKHSEYYLDKLIRRTNSQLEYLHRLKADSKKAENYEKRNYFRFLGKERKENEEKAYGQLYHLENEKDKYSTDVILHRFEIQNKVNKKEIQHEIRTLKAIDDHIKVNKYNKYNLTKEQIEDLNRIRRMEILKNDILEKAKSEEDIVKEYKDSKNNIKVNFYKNSKNIKINNFDLTYSQRMNAIFDKENLVEKYSSDQIKAMDKEIKNTNSRKKFINEYEKRKNVQDSLRRRKRYHLPEVKKNKTSLDKYSNEDEYNIVKGFKEIGIDVNKKMGNNKTTIRNLSPKN